MAQKLGKRQQAIIDAIAAGATLHKLIEGGRRVLFIEQIGEISKDSVDRLVKRGLIAEANDAMFGESISYKLTQPTA